MKHLFMVLAALMLTVSVQGQGFFTKSAKSTNDWFAETQGEPSWSINKDSDSVLTVVYNNGVTTYVYEKLDGLDKMYCTLAIIETTSPSFMAELKSNIDKNNDLYLKDPGEYIGFAGSVEYSLSYWYDSKTAIYIVVYKIKNY